MKKFDHKKINPKELTFTYDHTGYQLEYKGVMIGGAGALHGAASTQANIQFYYNQGKIARRNILQHGNCPDFMKQNLVDIGNGEIEWVKN